MLDSTNCDDDSKKAETKENEANSKNLNDNKPQELNNISSKPIISTATKSKFKANNYAKVVENGLKSKEQVWTESANSKLTNINYSFTNESKKNKNILDNKIDHSPRPSYSDNYSEVCLIRKQNAKRKEYLFLIVARIFSASIFCLFVII